MRSPSAAATTLPAMMAALAKQAKGMTVWDPSR